MTLQNQNIQHKITAVGDDVWRCSCGVSCFPDTQETRDSHLNMMIKLYGSLVKKMIYLASPHSHTSSAVREDRYKAALNCTKWLVLNKYWVYSPIVSNHNLFSPNEFEKYNVSWDYWQEFDTEMITRCDELWVLEMTGTADSKGVKAEIEIAKLQGKRIFHITEDKILGIDCHIEKYMIVEEKY